MMKNPCYKLYEPLYEDVAYTQGEVWSLCVRLSMNLELRSAHVALGRAVERNAKTADYPRLLSDIAVVSLPNGRGCRSVG